MELRQDNISKKERMEALLAGHPIDRVPLFPFLLGFCARNAGYPLSTIYRDPKKSFEAQLWTLEQYGFDWGPIYGYASYGTWEFGGEVKMPTGRYEQAPLHAMFPVQSEDDVKALELPDVKNAGCIPLAMEFSRLQEKYDMPISVVCGGNFTIAGNICAVEKLCRWMLKKPELAHTILQLATDHIVDIVQYWVDTFGPDQVIPQLWEPLAANDIISPKQFEEFVLPYLKESSQKILAMGVKHVLYHICGDQNANLPYWAQVSMGDPGLCSFGGQVDLSRTIELFEEKCIIIGNVDPGVLLNGSPEQIYDLCKNAIETGKQAARGYMLSSGCEISPESPGYHIYLMRKAINEFGWYE